MKRIVSGIITLTIVSAILCGCMKKQESISEKMEDFSVVENMRMQVKEEGIFYIDGYTDRMMFYDFGFDDSIPVCDRPNCKHDSAECNAYLPQGSMSGMGCYRDKIYYYDNMSQELPFYQCDKNGSNRKVLVELNKGEKYRNLSVSLPMFFVEDKVFFALTYFNFLAEPVTKEDGTLIDQEHFWMFGSVNLTNGIFEIVKEPEAYDHFREWIEVSDFVNGKIVYSTGDSRREQHIYDPKTGKDQRVLETAEGHIGYLGAVRDSGQILYGNAEGDSLVMYAVDVQMQEEETVLEKKAEEGKEIYGSVAGDNLVYTIYKQGKTPADGDEFGKYNFRTGEEEILTEEEYQYAPILAITGDWYVGQTEEGTICIPKEAYEKKEWDEVQVMGAY